MKVDKAAQAALKHLLGCLTGQDYRFVTPTPATQARIIARPGKQQAADLRDIFGWSLPFARELLCPQITETLEKAKLLVADGALMRSKVRVSSLGDHLFVHSAYPTDAEDAVFFGPDSYRFVRFLAAELPRLKPGRLVDLGAGAGVGGIMAGEMLPGCRVTLLDVNPAALRLAEINAGAASVEVECILGSAIDAVEGAIDIVIANPPYIMDEGERTYRDGGDMHGARISLDWSLAAAARLQPGGTMLLYTGVAIVGGKDALRAALEQALPKLGCTLRYRELDPDVFGEELEKPPYADVERIAAIGAVIGK